MKIRCRSRSISLLLQSLIFVIVVCCCCCNRVDCLSSGFYYDNGVDRTELLHHLDKYEMNQLENDIMNFIGVPSKRSAGHLISLRNSAPRFLLNVYDSLVNKENSVGYGRSKREVLPEDSLITNMDKKAFKQSDIIMAFLNKDHHASDVRHDHGRRLWIDVSEVSPDTALMMAELRIFLNPQLGKWHGMVAKPMAITVYSIVKTDGQKELEIAASINTTTDHFGWLEINVTSVLDKWLANPKENNGLYISAHELAEPRHEVRLSDIGYVNVHGDEAFQTFMVGYFKGPEIYKIPKSIRRTKRDTFTFKPKNPYVNYSKIKHQRSYQGPRECKLHFLHVSFDDIPSGDTIIAPQGYEAFFCKGDCAFPLNAHMNATSHAIVQALYHLTVGGVPKPSCAPIKLGAIQILYVVDENNVVLKKVKNMVVKNCGCL